MVQLLSLFITFCALALVLGRPVLLSDNNNQVGIQDYIADKVLPIATLLPKLTQPPKKLDDKLDPLSPKFGDLDAPRPPSLDPKGHGPLEGYTVAKLKSMSRHDARKFQENLIKKQLKKNASLMDNLAFLYLLDEAFYDVGIALDFDVNFIEFKLDQLAKFGIKEIAIPGGELDGLLNNDKSKSQVKVLADKVKEKEKDELSRQLLKRFLIAGKLTYIKRYIDSILKKLVQI